MTPPNRDPRIGQILSIVKAISVHMMELEKRVESIELGLKRPTYIDLTLDDPDYEDSTSGSSSDSSSEGYQSAPASFSYTT